MYHPTQILADLMTLHELYTPKGSEPHLTAPSSTLKNLRLAWVGDGNNILHSLMLQLPKVGMHISMATPKGYEPNADILSQAKQNAKAAGTEVGVFHDPKDAIRDADIIVTDTWYAMLPEMIDTYLQLWQIAFATRLKLTVFFFFIFRYL